MRDALHLARPVDDPGPAGRVLRQWSRAVARPILVAGLARAPEDIAADGVARRLDAVGPTPVDRAAAVIEAVLLDKPRAETAALILADAVLARSLGWAHVLPPVGLSPKPRNLIGTGPREPRRGAPYAVVTTESFLAAFGMEPLRDLPDPEPLEGAGLAAH